MNGLLVARVLLFFSFMIDEELHQCALVHWFSTLGNQPDPDNGMWVVVPKAAGQSRSVSVVHIDSIVRAAHLLPIFDKEPIPHTLNYTKTLDLFQGFYVNSYIDYHAYETVFNIIFHPLFKFGSPEAQKRRSSTGWQAVTLGKYITADSRQFVKEGSGVKHTRLVAINR